MVTARFSPQFRKWNAGSKDKLVREAIGKVHSWEVVNDFAASLCGHMVSRSSALSETNDDIDCGRCVRLKEV